MTMGGIILTYAEAAVIALTAATVVLGGVALILALAAIFGYRTLRNAAINFASKEVGEEMKKQLKSAGKGGEFDKAVRQALLKTVYGVPEEEESE